jgi:phosphoserine phosphatase
MAALHLFDLDGTLLYGTAAPVEISRQLGLAEEIRDLERAFAAREIDPPAFAAQVRDLWSDLTEAHVAAAFEGAPWLEGIREVWADIRERGGHCAVISLSPGFFVERLLDWGVHAAYGSRFPAVPFREPVDPAGILSPSAKVTIADALCARFGVERTDCVAYGDSMSDAPLFRALLRSVAVNADHHLGGLASFSYAGRDLREAYALVCDPR